MIFAYENSIRKALEGYERGMRGDGSSFPLSVAEGLHPLNPGR
jgi:hypothetical protein